MAVTINADDGVITGSAGYKLTPDASGVIQFQSSGVGTMQISAAGNVGIGNTPSGTYKLEVSGKTSATESYVTNGLMLTSNTISTSTTIPAGFNAISASPTTIANGVTVTVANGSRWTTV